MSYCVHCGVQLETSLPSCPLCNTPVVDPNKLIPTEPIIPPFPTENGSLEVVKRKDFGILLSIVLSATALSCGLLNAFVFTTGLWSLLIIGVCIIIWVFAIPVIIYTPMPIYVSLFLDGLAVSTYLYMISIVTPKETWFLGLALPITGIITGLALIFAFVYRHITKSLLSIALHIFIEIALLSVSLELLIAKYLDHPLKLTWSAVVLTACTIIAIALITVISKARLRNELRRRLHF
ncbi:MAG: DUF6320 domain-containing protein [Eubacteriales bacterium]